MFYTRALARTRENIHSTCDITKHTRMSVQNVNYNADLGRYVNGNWQVDSKVQ
jgi:hypothetical protein